MVSLFIFLLMVGAILTFGVVLIWAIGGNLRRGDQVRRKLARNLDTLRLGRALKMLGIDTERYLHSQRIVDIEAQMRSCGTCGDLARCDNTLKKGAVVEFDFCPNHDALGALRGAALAQQSRQ